MSIDCESKACADEGKRVLHVADVREWFDALPAGAQLHPIMWHGGTQRDPEEHMVGIRATWSENR